MVYKTDVRNGPFIAAMFVLIMICESIQVFVAFQFRAENETFYEFGLLFLEGYGNGDPLMVQVWKTLVWTPIVSGSIVLALCPAIIVTCLLTVKQIEVIERKIDEVLDSWRCIAILCCCWGKVVNEEGKLVRKPYYTERKERHNNILQSSAEGRFDHGTDRTIAVVSILAMAGILIQLISSSVFLSVLDTVDDAVLSTSQGGQIELGSFEQKLLDYEIALFNRCCYEKGWSQQDIIPPCPPGETTIDTCDLPFKYSSFKRELCTCYRTDEQTYNQYYQSIASSNQCELLNIDFTYSVQTKIPGSSLYAYQIFETDTVKIVGDYAAEGSGCGVGLVRGFQFILYQWLLDNAHPVAATNVAFSVIMLVLDLVVIYLAFCHTPPLELHYDRYGNLITIGRKESAPVRPPSPRRERFVKMASSSQVPNDADADEMVLELELSPPPLEPDSGRSSKRSVEAGNPLHHSAGQAKPVALSVTSLHDDDI